MNDMNKSSIWTKLLEIQNECPTFQQTDPSAKQTEGTSKEKYRYTPACVVVDRMRTMLNQKGLMCLMNIEDEKHELISYNIYRLINGVAQKFQKQEILSSIRVRYSFLDVLTGERTEDFVMYAHGCNGTDKSLPSALSVAEKYIFLKFFHITTRDEADEPDAHDAEIIRGMDGTQTPSSYQICRSQPDFQERPSQLNAPVQYAPQPAYPSQEQFPPQNPYPAPQPEFRSRPAVQYPPQQTAPAAPAAPAPQNAMAAPSHATPISYDEAVNALCYYNKGTATHQMKLQKLLEGLAANGYQTNSQDFIETLVETAQAHRESRKPNLNK